MKRIATLMMSVVLVSSNFVAGAFGDVLKVEKV